MRQLMIGIAALLLLSGCGDAVGEVLQQTGEALQNRARASFAAECITDGSESWAEFDARPGKTKVTVCYEAYQNVGTGRLTEPYCWHGYAWWNPTDPDTGWVFCNEDTISVTVHY